MTDRERRLAEDQAELQAEIDADFDEEMWAWIVQDQEKK